MTNRISFLDPDDVSIVNKVAVLMDELRPLEGERLADAEEALANMIVHDRHESDRRLRTELVRTVAFTQSPRMAVDVDPEDLRRRLFALAWSAHPGGMFEEGLFSTDRSELFNTVGGEFGIGAHEVEDRLFADAPAEQRLGFPAGEREAVARDAIRTLNLTRLRGGLADAVGLSLRIPSGSVGTTNYVQILWEARRLGLMFEAIETGDAITMVLSGPYSLFAKTTMYGNRLFEFTRRLMEHSNDDWMVRVDLLTPGETGRPGISYLRLAASHRRYFVHPDRVAPVGPRSDDEEAFQKYFQKLSSDWQLRYEGTLLLLRGQGRTYLMVPDFVAQSSLCPVDVLIEIVGFWKPEYLKKKMEKVRLLGKKHLILIVNSKLSVTRDEMALPHDSLTRVYFYSGREELKRVAGLVARDLESVAAGEEWRS